MALFKCLYSQYNNLTNVKQPLTLFKMIFKKHPILKKFSTCLKNIFTDFGFRYVSSSTTMTMAPAEIVYTMINDFGTLITPKVAIIFMFIVLLSRSKTEEYIYSTCILFGFVL